MDLSSVLFASSAVAASSDTPVAGSITAGTAMSLRLDGSPNNVDKKIGSVKASGDTISVTRGSTTETVALVVQGKGNDTNQDIDWYYSEKITEAKTIEKRSIQEKVKDKVYLQDEIELSSCKIWLEITDDGMLYAVEEHKHTYDGTWASNETDHWHQCTPANACSDLPDSIKDKDGHSFNDEEICTVCGYDARNGFTYHPELEATCKDTGNDEYREYKVGDEITYYQAYSAEEFGIQGARKIATISDAPIKPLNKDNHVDQNNDYKPYSKKYVKVDPSTHMIICSGCSAELGTASHDLVSNKCKDCGYTKSSNSSGGSSGSSSGSSYSNAGWIKDSKGWKYRNSYGMLAQGTTVTDADGNKVEKILWEKVGDKYFAIGSDGYLKTGWIYDRIDNKWSYCDENAGRLSGWFYEPQDGYWYYLYI